MIKLLRRKPISIWLVLGALGISALAVALFVNRLLLHAWPPKVICAEDSCKEAREWIAYSVTVLVLLGGLYQYWRAQLWLGSLTGDGMACGFEGDHVVVKCRVS